MSNNDLIRRGDALALPYRLSPSLDASDGYYVSVDAIRTLPAAQVTVKPLEWCENPDASEGGILGGGVTNSIYHAMPDGWSFHRGMFWHKAPTLEAAKAAAQADYEARIRSALTVTPHDPAKVEALVEAGERMTGPLWRLILADEHCLKSPCDMPTCECRQKFDRIAGPWTVALAAMKEG